MKGGILMLKFQTEYNTYIKTFEDFILTTFVIIDDLIDEVEKIEETLIINHTLK